MVAITSIALLSLLWMAVRLRRRRPFGMGASAALRFTWPVVLGLGGWCFAVLAVVAAWPAVRVDEWIVAVAIGLPIGAGVVLAWLDPTDRRARQAAGLALAGGSALAGAWLGFHATNGLLALLTTIAGAAAANLALIGLDASPLDAAPGAHEAPPAPAGSASDAQREVAPSSQSTQSWRPASPQARWAPRG